MGRRVVPHSAGPVAGAARDDRGAARRQRRQPGDRAPRAEVRAGPGALRRRRDRRRIIPPIASQRRASASLWRLQGQGAAARHHSAWARRAGPSGAGIHLGRARGPGMDADARAVRPHDRAGPGGWTDLLARSHPPPSRGWIGPDRDDTVPMGARDRRRSHAAHRSAAAVGLPAGRRHALRVRRYRLSRTGRAEGDRHLQRRAGGGCARRDRVGGHRSPRRGAVRGRATAAPRRHPHRSTGGARRDGGKQAQCESGFLRAGDVRGPGRRSARAARRRTHARPGRAAGEARASPAARAALPVCFHHQHRGATARRSGTGPDATGARERQQRRVHCQQLLCGPPPAGSLQRRVQARRGAGRPRLRPTRARCGKFGPRSPTSSLYPTESSSHANAR